MSGYLLDTNVVSELTKDNPTHLNPALPAEALDDAYRRLILPQGSTTEARNRDFHRMLVDGVGVEYRDDSGWLRGAQAQVIDFDNPQANRFLAVNQFTVIESQNRRRLDIALFVNGLPLGIIELKNPADADATVWTAFNQLQTYKAELPTLLAFNELLIPLMACRREWGRSPPGASGSSRGAPYRAKVWMIRGAPIFR